MLSIRSIVPDEFSLVWPFFHAIVKAGDTYGYDPELSLESARQVWCAADRTTYIAEDDGVVIGSFYLRANQQGPGAHVANGGVMIDPAQAGKGYGAQLGEMMVNEARELGYKALQFNFIAETNVASLKIWEKLGFDEIGTVPEAFQHPEQGYVAVKILHKIL